MISKFKILRDAGQLATLIPYAEISSDKEKGWIARYLLVYDEIYAKDILKEIVKKNPNSMAAFDAEMVLREWEKGTLNFD